jgi:IS605 OrfB family transposase
LISIKLPIKLNDQVKNIFENYLKEFNSILRFSYNRFVDGLNEKSIRHLIKSKNILNKFCDSWFVQCALKEALYVFEKDNSGKVIFGSKTLFKKRIENKISKEEFKLSRLLPLTIQGESPQSGNRKFKLDVLENNQIIFKPKFGIKIPIRLPKLRKKLKKQLCLIEDLSKQRQIPFSIKLHFDYIIISYDETKTVFEKNKTLKNNRIFGIDLNPNYLGWSVLEFGKNDNFKILDSGIIENKELNKNLKVSSNSKKQIYQNNKKTFELFEISKFLINKCIFYQCKKFSLEKLEILTKDHKKGRKFNRLINNCWNRNKLISNLNKRCNLNKIEFIQVNPVYSSFIGNLLHGDRFPDMVSSSIEISRRGYHKFKSGWFYPKLIDFDDLSNLWKKEINQKNLIFKNWKELFQITKTLKLKYRSSLEDFKESYRVFSLNNIKSKILLYSSV